jgi:acyl carrier protein
MHSVAGEPEPGPPRSRSEQIIARIWEDILNVASVGVDDDFFSLGGHSIAAARMVARVSEIFDVELPLRVVFDHRTVAGLAQTVATRVAEEITAMPPAAVTAALTEEPH